MGPQRFDEPAAPTTATVWPICFAVGVAVLLVGLIVITILAGFVCVRGGHVQR